MKNKNNFSAHLVRKSHLWTKTIAKTLLHYINLHLSYLNSHNAMASRKLPE